MRRPGALLAVLAAAALLLAGCAPARDVGGPDPQLRGQWELESAKDAAGKLALADQRITLTIGSDTTTSGRSSCSDYTARVFGTTSGLWVDPTLPKETNCRTGSQKLLETRYIRDLRSVHYGAISSGVLTLRAAKVTLVFSRALKIPLTLMTNRVWTIESITLDTSTTAPDLLEHAPVAASGATIMFSKSGTLSGSDGCRGFSAQYTENAGEIVIRDLQSGKTGCSEDALNVDAYLMSVLTSGFTWLSANGQLNIDSPRVGVGLYFVEDRIRKIELGG